MNAIEVGERIKACPRILVMVRQHIGDVVSSTAGIHAIRQNCPNAHIAVSCGEKAVSVLENSPDFNQLIARPWKRDLKSKLPYLWEMRKGHFEAAIILDEVGSQVRNAKSAGIPLRAAITLETNPKDLAAWVPFNDKLHDTRGQNFALLEALGFEQDDRPRLYPSIEDEAYVESLMKPLNGPLVAVHPGASERTRRWHPERFAEMVRRLSDTATVLITGSAAELELCDDVAKLSGVDPTVLAGKLSVLQFAALCKRLRTVVIGDTGPTHIAGAMGTHVVALFGPTHPDKTGPWGQGHQLLLGTCGCGNRDWRTCNYSCMESIAVDAVVNAALAQLEAVRS